MSRQNILSCIEIVYFTRSVNDTKRQKHDRQKIAARIFYVSRVWAGPCRYSVNMEATVLGRGHRQTNRIRPGTPGNL
jgi:hypothetical protein